MPSQHVESVWEGDLTCVKHRHRFVVKNKDSKDFIVRLTKIAVSAC